MLKVAVTGNIGSGKSTVTRIFKSLGIPVFEADAEAKNLYTEKEVIEEVKNQFGNDIFNSEGILIKQKLAEIVFSDQKALLKINQIIHPRTLNKYYEWLKIYKNEDYTIHESAILFENNLQNHFDKIITVFAPQQIRMERVIARDGINEEIILKRMKNQLSDELKNNKADFVVYNDGANFVIPQVIEIDRKLKSL